MMTEKSGSGLEEIFSRLILQFWTDMGVFWVYKLVYLDYKIVFFKYF